MIFDRHINGAILFYGLLDIVTHGLDQRHTSETGLGASKIPHHSLYHGLRKTAVLFSKDHILYSDVLHKKYQIVDLYTWVSLVCDGALRGMDYACCVRSQLQTYGNVDTYRLYDRSLFQV